MKRALHPFFLLITLLILAFPQLHCGGEGGTETGNPQQPTSDPGIEDAGGDSGEDAGTSNEDPDDIQGDSDNATNTNLSGALFLTLAKNDGGNLNLEEQYLIIDNAEEFSDLWSALYEDSLDMPEMPVANFNTDILLAAIHGDTPSSGYAIQITDIEIIENELLISVTKTMPGNNCWVLDSMRNPFHIISLPREMVPGHSSFSIKIKTKKYACTE